jgi:exodeoxyribonuclease VII large subunit
MEKQYLNVTALTKYIKYKFDHDTHLKNVFLKGEVSNFKHHSRGHFYFTLKDEKSQISAIMFASSSSKVIFKPEDGMSVLVEGYISVFEASGQYQIYVKSMLEEGKGNLYLAYEQLKKELAEKGLFDAKHKQPIPRFPKRIAVLTSPTGAAVRDVINIVNRRYPLTEIIVYPTLVQGENAKDSIIKQLEQANNDELCDVIILGRGGGSIEDLWPFNEEMVAHAIFKSKIPIISSVGHETDFTISDFVADLRAPTPSGAAELAVPSQQEILQHLLNMKNQSRNSVMTLLRRKKEQLDRMKDSVIFRDPQRLTETYFNRLSKAEEKLQLLSPKNKLKQSKKDLLQVKKDLNQVYKQVISSKQNAFNMLINTLELVNPLSIMKKGYSTTIKDGVFIKSVQDLKKGDVIDVEMHDGRINAQVNEIERNET